MDVCPGYAVKLTASSTVAMSFGILNHFQLFSRRVGTPRTHSLLLYQSNDRQTKRDHPTGHECMHALATAACLQDQILLSPWRWNSRCVLYIGLQIFALQQNWKLGVRIIHRCALYLRLYGSHHHWNYAEFESNTWISFNFRFSADPVAYQILVNAGLKSSVKQLWDDHIAECSLSAAHGSKQLTGECFSDTLGLSSGILSSSAVSSRVRVWPQPSDVCRLLLHSRVQDSWVMCYC